MQADDAERRLEEAFKKIINANQLKTGLNMGEHT